VQRAGLRRTAATAVAAGTCFAAGIATVLSFNLWAGWHPLALLPGFERSTVFDLLDYLTSNVLLPLGGFAIALFAGWAAPAGLLVEELRLGPAMARALRVLLRFVAPVAIAATAVSPWLIAAAKRA
jgi:NSS family neurotransmitter:Na+ symporter